MTFAFTFRRALLGLLAVLCLSARAADPGLIDINDRELVDDLRWLVDRRVLSLPVGTWPLPASTVLAALSKARGEVASEADRSALLRVQSGLQRLAAPAMLGVQLNAERHLLLSGEQPTRAQAEASASLQHVDEHLLARLRVAQLHEPLGQRDNGAALDGSYAGIRGESALAVFGVLDRWWGPGVMTSPLLSNTAPPIPGLLVRRVADSAPQWNLLQWIGPWGYELSLGRLRDYTPAHARTIGMRLYARPLPGVELGASRFIYWAGAGRPSGAGTFIDAVTGNSNVEAGDPNPDPSNELSGFDLRWSFPVATSDAAVAYVHALGEDEAGYLPSQWFGTVGVQYKRAAGEHRLEWTLEGSDTQLGRFFGLRSRQGRGPAYRHSTYVAGHYHQGVPIGALIGGGGHSLGLGLAWVLPAGHRLDRVSFDVARARINWRGAEPLNAVFGAPTQLDNVALRVRSAGEAMRWNLGLSVQRDSAASQTSVGLLAGFEFRFGR